MSEEEYQIGESVMILTDNKTLLPYNTALGVIIDKRQELINKEKTYIYKIKFVTTLANSECHFYAKDLRHTNDYYPEFLTYCKIIDPLTDQIFSILGCKKRKHDNKEVVDILIPDKYFDFNNKWLCLDALLEKGWKLK